MLNNYLYTLLVSVSVSMANITLAAETDENTLADTVQAEESDPSADSAATTADTDKAPLTEEQIERERTISRYAEQIQKLESESGVYNSELVEQLLGLGLAYGSGGNHVEALKVYQRALQISRVNNGLHTLDQIPILERIIETNSAMKHFDELNQNYNYMLWVYGRNYGGQDAPAMAPVLERVANWHLGTYEANTAPQSVPHLIAASNSFRKVFALKGAIQNPDNPELIAPLYGIYQSHLKLVERFGFISPMRVREIYDPSQYAPGGMPDYIKYINFIPREFSRADLNDFQKLEPYTLSAIQNSFILGRDVLTEILRIYEVNPKLPALDYARTLMELADWLFKFEQKDRSGPVYIKAYQLLTDISQGDVTRIDKTFTEPHSLGLIGTNTYGAAQATNLAGKSDEEIQQFLSQGLKDKLYLAASFNISSYGTVNNFEVIQSNPDNPRFRNDVKRKVQTVPFRPKYENGKPIQQENVKMVYTFQNE